jgi:hypothetical protein
MTKTQKDKMRRSGIVQGKSMERKTGRQAFRHVSILIDKRPIVLDDEARSSEGLKSGGLRQSRLDQCRRGSWS